MPHAKLENVREKKSDMGSHVEWIKYCEHFSLKEVENSCKNNLLSSPPSP